MRLRWSGRGLSLAVGLIVLVGLCTSAAGAGAGATAPPSGSGPGASRMPSLANDCTPANAPTARPDGSLDQTFADQLGPGWVGGDATYSTQLPDGREVFDFADTLIGTAQSDGTADFTGLIHSSELYRWLPRLRSDYGGSFTAPQSLIPDSLGDGDHWQVAATTVENRSQLIFVNEFATQAGPFDSFTGRSGIAVMTLGRHAAPAFRFIVPLPTDPSTQWGTALMEYHGDAYVYGDVSDPSGQFEGMKLARVPRGDVLATKAWQYWNGTGWVAGEESATTLATVNELTGVVPQADHAGFEAVSIPNSVFTDTAIDLSYACSPEGPWSAPDAVYAIPPVVGLVDQIAYIPTFHPELSRPRWDAVVSYNVNSVAGLSPLQADIHGYQPHFVVLASNPSVRTGDPPPAQTPEAPLPLLLPVLAAAAIAVTFGLRNRRLRVTRRARGLPNSP
jgi:hypothetical protein